ncbi:MAG: dolichyl-phosphate-mannose--protein mannosyltransferase, partial [Pseudomonadota bacterium]|nr:dolichyl-phosphate-mannose--protein mannosyltransferase [Pseudomonadota bacterium]
VGVAAGLTCLVLVGIATWQAPRSSRALAAALASGMEPQDRVAMVDDYLYDVPFYARLARPVWLVGDWSDPDIPRRDNWRKEIFDAARFDPAMGREVLRPLTDIDRLACGAARSVWFVVGTGRAAGVAAQPGAQRRYADSRHELWRVPGRPACN